MLKSSFQRASDLAGFLTEKMIPMPGGTGCAEGFWFAWIAFYPGTELIE